MIDVRLRNTNLMVQSDSVRELRVMISLRWCGFELLPEPHPGTGPPMLHPILFQPSKYIHRNDSRTWRKSLLNWRWPKTSKPPRLVSPMLGAISILYDPMQVSAAVNNAARHIIAVYCRQARAVHTMHTLIWSLCTCTYHQLLATHSHIHSWTIPVEFPSIAPKFQVAYPPCGFVGEEESWYTISLGHHAAKPHYWFAITLLILIHPRLWGTAPRSSVPFYLVFYLRCSVLTRFVIFTWFLKLEKIPWSYLHHVDPFQFRIAYLSRCTLEIYSIIILNHAFNPPRWHVQLGGNYFILDHRHNSSHSTRHFQNTDKEHDDDWAIHPLRWLVDSCSLFDVCFALYFDSLRRVHTIAKADAL